MCRDRLPPLRQFAQLRHIEIAVAKQSEGPRDWRRRHVKNMWRRSAGRAGGFGVERRTLAHSESMLFVDDNNGESVEQHIVLNQRMRTNENPELPRCELPEQIAPAGGGRRAGQQRDWHCLPWHQLLKRREVLVGERLGRRHQRRLMSVFDGTQHRRERNDRLARTNFTHQQPLHRVAPGDVAEHDRHGAFLIAG
ncbi:unannotated protein [freshwater metagenome]|uniref:Unannotated protein n=1 Tax=freshwater metagenome TaxID=449393 RepID=A0A6J7S4X5_9ZZZZ